jgi:adenosylcobyric acid synthase
MADAPVLLVADIDKGGALASVVGTLELVADDDRDRIAGFIINKFRGDLSLFQPAVDFLEKKTGKTVFGVVPYFQGFRIQEEDTVSEDRCAVEKVSDTDRVDIAVIHLPHISNFTDFDPLEDEPDVRLSYVGRGNRLGNPDLIIIPGSKNTIEDLYYLKRSGLAARITELNRSGTPVIGICGGFQMLGSDLNDPLHTESEIPQMTGLGLLNMSTTFYLEKVTTQVEAEVAGEGSLLSGAKGFRVAGYEIHMGKTELAPGVYPAVRVLESSGKKTDAPDGAVSRDGTVFGTYIHGIFDSDQFRRQVLNNLRSKKGFEPLAPSESVPALEQRSKDLDKLAAVVRGSLDMGKIYSLMGLK